MGPRVLVVGLDLEQVFWGLVLVGFGEAIHWVGFFFLGGFCVLKGVSVFCFFQGDDGRIDQTKGKKEEGNKMIKKMRQKHKDTWVNQKHFKSVKRGIHK